jgi:hypothetical protein
VNQLVRDVEVALVEELIENAARDLLVLLRVRHRREAIEE